MLHLLSIDHLKFGKVDKSVSPKEVRKLVVTVHLFRVVPPVVNSRDSQYLPIEL